MGSVLTSLPPPTPIPPCFHYTKLQNVLLHITLWVRKKIRGNTLIIIHQSYKQRRATTLLELYSHEAGTLKAYSSSSAQHWNKWLIHTQCATECRWHDVQIQLLFFCPKCGIVHWYCPLWQQCMTSPAQRWERWESSGETGNHTTNVHKFY